MDTPVTLPDLSGLTDEELQTEFTRKYGIADHLSSGEEVGTDNEAYIQAYEAECKKRGLDSGLASSPVRLQLDDVLEPLVKKFLPAILAWLDDNNFIAPVTIRSISSMDGSLYYWLLRIAFPNCREFVLSPRGEDACSKFLILILADAFPGKKLDTAGCGHVCHFTVDNPSPELQRLLEDDGVAKPADADNPMGLITEEFYQR